MKVFLIRHGEQKFLYDTQGRKLVSTPAAPLMELGRRQMQELGRQLRAEGQTLDAVYRSPLLRAKQSAEELVDEQSVSVYVVDDLDEVNPNSAEGKTFWELEKIGGDMYAHPFSNNQEGLDHLVERGRSAIEFILSDAKERGYKTVGILGHGDPLCALDWAMKHEDMPFSYDEMKGALYMQKGQAQEYAIGSDLKIVGEGRLITTEAAREAIEGFRARQGTK